MDALTINEASATTGWSPRMLRYIERAGLVEPARSEAGYRLYGPGALQKLRTLRELLAENDVGLTDIGFAKRLRDDAVEAILDRAGGDARGALTLLGGKWPYLAFALLAVLAGADALVSSPGW